MFGVSPCVCAFPLHVLPALISRSLVSSLFLVDISNHMFMQLDQFFQGLEVSIGGGFTVSVTYVSLHH